MGFKFINSREYRELCERIAFVEADLKEAKDALAKKERELEVKNENIKQLKKDIVRYDEENKEIRKSNSELRTACEELNNQLASVTVGIVAVPEGCPKEEKKTVAKKPAARRTARKPKKD